MTFAVSETQLAFYVVGCIAIQFGMMYLAIKWWAPRIPLCVVRKEIVYRDRYLTVSDHHTESSKATAPEPVVPKAQSVFKQLELRGESINALKKLGHKHADAARIVNCVIDGCTTVEEVIQKSYAKPSK